MSSAEHAHQSTPPRELEIDEKFAGEEVRIPDFDDMEFELLVRDELPCTTGRAGCGW